MALNNLFFPSTFQEFFSTWSQYNNAVLYAGGSQIIRKQGKRFPTLPDNIISLEKMHELQKINRSERHLEIGAMVKLNQIINLGKIVPEALNLCLQNIAGPQLRSLATIGGNLCNQHRRLDACIPMIALDAQYELRTALTTRWISASRFSSLPGPPILAPQEILTRIRVPLDPWDFIWYRKLSIPGSSEPGGGILFIMRNQKNILTDIRVVYSGKAVLREKNCETMLAGKHLPLGYKETKAFIDGWKTYLSVIEGIESSIFPGNAEQISSELIKTQILGFIETTIMRISD